MGKSFSFLFIMAAFSVVVCISDLSAQDFHNGPAPIIAEDSLVATSNQIPCSIFMAQNTAEKSKESDIDAQILDDYPEIDKSKTVSDPLYYFNFVMFSLNDVLYFALLKPVSTVYKAITPDFFRQAIQNFFHNLLFPVRFVNNILQGQFNAAGNEAGIFFINSTIGVLGLAQVAQSEWGLMTKDEDFGQTLGTYSIGNGFYLVLPVIGPSTMRDVLGLAGDYFLKPVSYVEPWELSAGISAYQTINTLSFHLGEYEALKEAAIDPYISLRNAYIENRAKKIKE